MHCDKEYAWVNGMWQLALHIKSKWPDPLHMTLNKYNSAKCFIELICLTDSELLLRDFCDRELAKFVLADILNSTY